MKTNLLTLVIMLTVGVILAGSLLVPLTDDYSTAEYTIENEGMPYAKAGGNHTIVVTADTMTFDGEPVDISLFPGNFTSYTIVYGEESFIRWGTTNVIIVSDADGLHSFNISTNTITITIADNVATVSSSGSATTYSIDDVMYYMSPTGGDYVLALTPYANDESVIYAAGDTYYLATGGRPAALRVWNIWTAVDGEVTVVSCNTGSSGYTALTVSNITTDYENIKSNLYRYNSVVFDYTATYTADETDTDYPLTATYTYFLAPATVTYDNPNYVSTGAGLIATLPILVIVALVLAAVGAIYVGRRD